MKYAMPMCLPARWDEGQNGLGLRAGWIVAVSQPSDRREKALLLGEDGKLTWFRLDRVTVNVASLKADRA